MGLRIVNRRTPLLDSRLAVTSITTLEVQEFTVRLRDNQFFRRRDPVRLTLDPRRGVVCVAEYMLPAGSFTITQALSLDEINLNWRHALTISAVSDDHSEVNKGTEWKHIVGMLRLFSWSPRGFMLLRPLAVGEISAIYRALDLSTPDRTQVAVKETRRIDLHHAHIAPTQATIGLRTIANIPYHPRLLQPMRVFWERGSLFQVSPIAAGGSLRDALTTMRESGCRYSLPVHYVRGITRDILQAIAHLHAHGAVHRNVSLDHVLLSSSLDMGDSNGANGGDECRALLAGFGLVTKEDDFQNGNSHVRAHATRRTQGDAQAAEARKGVNQGVAADVWGVGVVLFALMFGNAAWTSGPELDRSVRSMRALVARNESHLRAIVPLVAISALPDDLRSLLSGLLQPSPTRRLTARAALEHRALRPHPAIHSSTTKTTSSSRKDSQESFRVLVRKLVSVVSLVDAWQVTAGITRPNTVILCST